MFIPNRLPFSVVSRLGLTCYTRLRPRSIVPSNAPSQPLAHLIQRAYYRITLSQVDHSFNDSVSPHLFSNNLLISTSLLSQWPPPTSLSVSSPSPSLRPSRTSHAPLSPPSPRSRSSSFNSRSRLASPRSSPPRGTLPSPSAALAVAASASPPTASPLAPSSTLASPRVSSGPSGSPS